MFSRGIIYAQTCRVYSTIEKIKTCFVQQKNFNGLLGLMGGRNKEILDNQQKTKQQQENNSGQYVKKFLFSASISAGIYVILSLRKKDFSSDCWIPSVFAASPLHKTGINKLFDQEPNTGSEKKGIRKTYNFIADAAEKVSDAVVFIAVKSHIRRNYQENFQTLSNGSGFIISEDGLIMTNAHVVGNRPRASSIMVKLVDGREFEGKIEELDARSDLALLRIDCKDLKSSNLGSSKDLRAGEFVVAVGSPLSLSNSVTSGVISSVARKSKEMGLTGPETEYIQIDAAITFGNSGGPLINLDGEVIGINSMKVASGISFAIPIDYAKEFLSKAQQKRAFMAKRKEENGPTNKRRYLGMTMFSLSPELVMELQNRGDIPLKLPFDITQGLLVWRVAEGSPAYYAGLTPGDVITHINGKSLHSITQTYALLEGRGDLHMVVIRGKERYSVVVAPEE